MSQKLGDRAGIVLGLDLGTRAYSTALIGGLNPDQRDKVAKFLELYAVSGNLAQSLESAGVTFWLHHRLSQGDPEYKLALNAALEYSVAKLEGVVFDRAMTGSDEAARLWLRANAPDRYNRAVVDQEHSGEVNVVVAFEGQKWQSPEHKSVERQALPPA